VLFEGYTIVHMTIRNWNLNGASAKKGATAENLRGGEVGEDCSLTRRSCVIAARMLGSSGGTT